MKLGKRDVFILLSSSLCLFVYTYHYFFLANTTLYNAVSYSIPLMLVWNIVILMISFWSNLKFLWMLPVILLVYSCRILPGFIAFDFFDKEEPDTSVIKVLSYNVGTFNLDRFHTTDSLRLSDSILIQNQMKFLKTCKADVICLQEFYNNDALGFTTILNEMTDMGYKYFYTNPIRIEDYQGFFGVITFSKFPIADKGKISFEYKENKRALNTAIFTDIVVGEDTIRVINVHLHSMDLRAQRVLSSLPSDTLVDELNLFKEKMEYGFIKRGRQTMILEDEILKEAGHKILVGDLNDMPFSFSYRTIRKYLANSFEEAGKGFGFTYNKFPWFIRIDNQFYSPSLKVTSFEVLEDNDLSDHYPIVAGYAIQ
jgi:endonuclease/exonuclease/phosphatase family metal-dependent hydrolase